MPQLSPTTQPATITPQYKEGSAPVPTTGPTVTIDTTDPNGDAPAPTPDEEAMDAAGKAGSALVPVLLVGAVGLALYLGLRR